MSAEAEFYVPDDETLRELGRMQVLHSHLDHTLRLSIKRMLGISIRDPGYWNETRGMTAGLRQRARDLVAKRYGRDQDSANAVNQILDEAEAATLLRNRALHGVWMRHDGNAPVLHDRDSLLKQHVSYPAPTAEELVSVSDWICRLQRHLNYLTRKLLTQ